MIIRDNFSYFSSKPYVVTPHLNRLVEMVQMWGHKKITCFLGELTKVIPYYHEYSYLSRLLHMPGRHSYILTKKFKIQASAVYNNTIRPVHT